jgi:hypothetical protein
MAADSQHSHTSSPSPFRAPFPTDYIGNKRGNLPAWPQLRERDDATRGWRREVVEFKALTQQALSVPNNEPDNIAAILHFIRDKRDSLVSALASRYETLVLIVWKQQLPTKAGDSLRFLAEHTIEEMTTLIRCNAAAVAAAAAAASPFPVDDDDDDPVVKATMRRNFMNNYLIHHNITDGNGPCLVCALERAARGEPTGIPIPSDIEQLLSAIAELEGNLKIQ